MSISDNKHLELLYRIAHALLEQDMNVQPILHTVLSMTGDALGAEHGCLMMFDNDVHIQDASILNISDNSTYERKLWNLLISRGFIGFVHYGRKTVVLGDLSADARWPARPDRSPVPREGSAVGLPVVKDGLVHGVLLLIHPQVGYFTRDIVSMLETIADLTATAVAKALTFHQVYASQARYQNLFSGSLVPIILTDLRGQVVDANREACDFLGFAPETITGLHITAIHRLGTGPLDSDRFASLPEGEQVEFRTSVRTASGKDLPVLVRARRLVFPDGDLVEWIEHDIGPQLELEQLRADLTAMVYHDLRGPLHAINSSFVALNRLLINHDSDTIRSVIEAGTRSTHQLARLVESLLDIQRLEEGAGVLDRKPTELNPLLAAAAEMVQPLAADAGQRLTLDLADNLPPIRIDGDMIQRVIINLIENAVKYSPEGGHIVVGAGILDEQVCITVADSGPGIPKHMHRQIFDKFSRVKYTDAPRGMGLGLAFCRLAVEAHGGQIWVDSEPGQGSVFYFTLPLEEQLAAV